MKSIKTYSLVAIFITLPLLGASCQIGNQSQDIACAYNGQRYEVGSSFTAEDGCNTCTCDQNGQIACTEKACPSALGLDQCTIDSDCLNQGIDTSFCSDGQWSCINSMCEFSCEIE